MTDKEPRLYFFMVKDHTRGGLRSIPNLGPVTAPAVAEALALSEARAINDEVIVVGIEPAICWTVTP